MKQLFFFLFLFITISFQAQEWQQSKEKTKVEFKIKNFGVNVDGSFSDIEIKTNFSKDQLSKSFLNAKIKIKSIETGIQGRDKSILKEGYFHEEKFPYLELKSIKIKESKNGIFTLFANLTIKETTKQIKIPLTIKETDKTLSIVADFSINRKDFKVGGGSLVMSKKVKIHVEYFGSKPQ